MLRSAAFALLLFGLTLWLDGCGGGGHASIDGGPPVDDIKKNPDNGGYTKDEIVVGMSAAFTKSSRALGIELYRGSQAYFSYINESGGVNGRKIRMVAYDDRYEPDPAVRNTLKLMNEDNVFLLMDYVGTPTMNRVLPVLKKAQDRKFYLFFPFTGAATNRRAPYDAFSFNLRASYGQETKGLVDHFVEINRKKIAVFFQADAYGRAGWTGVRNALAKQGLTLAGEATYKRGSAYGDSYDQQVALMQEIKPDAVICIGAYSACAGFVRDCRNKKLIDDAGDDVPIANISFVGSEALLNLLLAEEKKGGKDYTGRLVNSQVVPSYHDEKNTVVREYRERMDKYKDQIMPPKDMLYPTVSGTLPESTYEPFQYSFSSLEGYLNAKLLCEILAQGGDKLNRADIPKYVEKIQELELGMGDKVSFSGTKRQGSDRVFYTVEKENKFELFDGWAEWAKK